MENNPPAPVPSVNVTQTVTPPTTNSSDPGYIAAFIGLGILVALTIIIADLVGLVGSGIYLGLTKKIGPKTLKLFYILALFFVLVYEVLKGNFAKNAATSRGMGFALLVLALEIFIMPLIAIGIAKATHHLSKKN